jgi:hypothetical protein
MRGEMLATVRTNGGSKLDGYETSVSEKEGTAGEPALKPYWGKLAVRNFRGDDGNVGIIRSPVRAIALPDRAVRG